MAYETDRQNWLRIHSEIKADTAIRTLLESNDSTALEQLAERYKGEHIATGGGCEATLIRTGEHSCVAVSNINNGTAFYAHAALTEPYDIFWGELDDEAVNEFMEFSE